MRKQSTLLLLVLLVSTNWLLAQIPSGYYTPATGLTGAQLKTALYNIIKDHTVKSYDYLWTAYQTTDKKANGKVWDMYSDVPGGTPPYEYTFGTNQCGNYSGENSCYNREHNTLLVLTNVAIIQERTRVITVSIVSLKAGSMTLPPW